ncbi:MAG: carboxylating nicotinate-nucleotide diphosphorylase [Proteobacteria bacterium]|nr:carboxylating nicotinate-nucleotide diphosphorylase [Pseudomonadota bacterium]
MPALPADLANQVGAALREDLGSGDVSAALVPASQQVSGRVITREDAVLCGTAWVNEVFRQLDPAVRVTWYAQDGAAISAEQVLFEVAGPARAILTGERTALNFLQLLSGVATVARTFADAVAGTHCQILDTRKTLPGLRTAQKYAVVCGGATNHRMGLFDRVLIKENHIVAAGSITRAIVTARTLNPGITVEVEVESLKQLAEALPASPDIVLLDNFTHADMRAAVALRNQAARTVKLEASGSMSLELVRGVAATGVDYISVGSLTKHVQAVDLSMRLEFSGSTVLVSGS